MKEYKNGRGSRVIKGTTESHHKLRITHGCQKQSIDDLLSKIDKKQEAEE